MPAALNHDIFSCIISTLRAERRKLDKLPYPQLQTKESRLDAKNAKEARDTLLVLRRTCIFLADAITPLFFSNITISKIDKESARLLERMQRSAWIPPVVKIYTLKPAIVHTAPGEYRVDYLPFDSFVIN